MKRPPAIGELELLQPQGRRHDMVGRFGLGRHGVVG